MPQAQYPLDNESFVMSCLIGSGSFTGGFGILARGPDVDMHPDSEQEMNTMKSIRIIFINSP
jgi:hypothetical protein